MKIKRQKSFLSFYFIEHIVIHSTLSDQENKLTRREIKKQIVIKPKGEGNITFYANNSRKGLYSYSIIADGKLIDAKKMIH